MTEVAAVYSLSEPSFNDEFEWGLKTPSVSCTLQDADENTFNPDVAALLDEVLGAWEAPEIETLFEPAPSGRARQLLGWVYRLQKQAEWPVFQLGSFEPADGSDLSGTYHLPSRIGPKFLAYRFFAFVLNALCSDPQQWNRTEFEQHLKGFTQIFTRHRLSGSSRRIVLLELHRRGQKLVEIASDLYQVGPPELGSFIRGTMNEKSSYLLVEIQKDKVATARLLRLNGIPTVEHRRVHSLEQAEAAAEALGYPVVLKPFNGNQKRHVHVNIPDVQSLRTIMNSGEFPIETGLVEKHVNGDTFRFHYVEGHLLLIALRRRVIFEGDGQRTLLDFVKEHCALEINEEKIQKAPMDVSTFLTKNEVEPRLRKDGLTLDHVLSVGETFHASTIPSWRNGCVSEYIEIDALNETVQQDLKSILTLFQHGSIGIDAIGQLSDEKLIFNEINFGPSMKPHYPHYMSRYMDHMFPFTVSRDK